MTITPAMLRMIERHTQQLDKLDTTSLQKLSKVFGVSWDRIDGDVWQLINAIMKMDGPTIEAVRATAEYQRLIRRATEELDAFGKYLDGTIGGAGSVAAQIGLKQSSELISSLTGAKFQGMQKRALGPLLGYLQEGSPLYNRLGMITTSTVDKVVQAIAQGVGLGQNPRTIARGIQDAFGGGLTDALRNVRTVQLWAYRDAARANYISSDGVVQGWIWFAHLDASVCLSCCAQHGSIHPLEETLDDHYNGRCVAIPYLPEIGNPISENGEDWFNKLPQEQRVSMMGQAKLDAYEAKKFEFSALSAQHPNAVYGTMRTEASLKELLSGYTAPPVAPPPPPPVAPPAPTVVPSMGDLLSKQAGQPQGALSKVQVPEFKNNKQAAKWLMDQGYVKRADFGKLDIRISQKVAERAAYYYENYPELKGKMNYLGSSQSRKTIFKELYRQELEVKIRAKMVGAPEQDIQNAIDFWMRRTNFGKVDGHAYASSYSGSRFPDLNGIAINEKFGKDMSVMERTLSRDVASSWHPPFTDNIAATIDHEFGHQLDDLLSIIDSRDHFNDADLVDAIRAALRRPDGSMMSIKEGLSGYADTANVELLAEAWAEYLNNPSPRALAKAVGEFILQKYKITHYNIVK